MYIYIYIYIYKYNHGCIITVFVPKESCLLILSKRIVESTWLKKWMKKWIGH